MLYGEMLDIFSVLFSICRPGFNPRVVHVKFVTNKVTMRQVSLQELRFFLSIILPAMLHTYIHLPSTLHFSKFRF